MNPGWRFKAVLFAYPVNGNNDVGKFWGVREIAIRNGFDLFHLP